MEHVQTKLIDCYSPLSPPHPPTRPSQLCLIVALRPYPLSTPSSCALSVFCGFFRKQYIQPSKCYWCEPIASRRSLPVHEYENINATGGQDTLLTCPSRIQKGRYKSRKGWPWSGALVEAKITSFCGRYSVVVVIPLSPKQS